MKQISLLWNRNEEMWYMTNTENESSVFNTEELIDYINNVVLEDENDC